MTQLVQRHSKVFFNLYSFIHLINSSNQLFLHFLATLTPGYAAINKIKQISCSADNKTYPYTIHTSITFNLDFNGNLLFSINCFDALKRRLYSFD